MAWLQQYKFWYLIMLWPHVTLVISLRNTQSCSKSWTPPTPSYTHIYIYIYIYIHIHIHTSYTHTHIPTHTNTEVLNQIDNVSHHHRLLYPLLLYFLILRWDWWIVPFSHKNIISALEYCIHLHSCAYPILYLRHKQLNLPVHPPLWVHYPY